MNRKIKILVNVVIFILVVGFVWMVVLSLKNDGEQFDAVAASDRSVPFISPCTRLFDIPLTHELNRFELSGDRLYISVADSIFIYSVEGKRLGLFKTDSELRDLTVNGAELFLLYPNRVKVVSLDGREKRTFEACSDDSQYCSIVVSGDNVFVTDAQNRNICRYRRDGTFLGFANSPREFVVPHFSFDIDIWNDTVYCVNPGRHLIESYTLNGDFIRETGGPDGKDGFFSGCSNPSFISFTPEGKMLASDQGKPRVSLYDRDGNSLEQLFNSKDTGGGTTASEVKAGQGRYYVGERYKIVVYKNENGDR